MAIAEPCVAVFAKAPIAGLVKTRLMPALGAEGAADLHRALVRHTLTTVANAGFTSVTLWCAPDVGHSFFADCAMDFGIALAAQCLGDLGGRMAHAFACQTPCLLLGSDCPSITAAHLVACARGLADNDAVFLPAEDGGYGLVGLNRSVPRLFEGIAWGTSEVMAQTRERLRLLKMKNAEIVTIWDVDTPADLARLDASSLLSLPASPG